MYGAKIQYSYTRTAELVDTQSTLYVQKVCRTFLYYAISVDQTMLVFMNTITTSQSHYTTTPMGDIMWLINYAETHPNATLHYRAEDMILHVARNVSYLCEECARS